MPYTICQGTLARIVLLVLQSFQDGKHSRVFLIIDPCWMFENRVVFPLRFGRDANEERF